MNNGYFKLVNNQDGYGLALIPPKEGGEEINLSEVVEYLNVRDINYDPVALQEMAMKGEVAILYLGEGDCPIVNESYKIDVNADYLYVTIRFYPPSDTGKRIELDEILNDLRFRNIKYGIQMQVLQEHMQEAIYCTDLMVAKGKEPRHGTDAHIEYFFNTDVQARPTMKEDGSVDFFSLNLVNHCQAGDLLARITPEDTGEFGKNVLGAPIKPRDVKRVTLNFGANVEPSENKLEIRAMVSGHVVLENDKVIVSDIFIVDNVDNSTGDIHFEGSVQINGNVQSNFHVNAKGNVIIQGVVEGAYIDAGGDIIISRGMNGMGKGTLKAGGNVVAKFLENVTVTADGYVSSGAILHSHVMAGTEVEVSGKRGFITGGHVSATSKISVKTLGAELGASTIVEVGANPQLKQRYHDLQKELEESARNVKGKQTILENLALKRAKGAVFNDMQKTYIIGLAKELEQMKANFDSMNAEFIDLQMKVESEKNAVVIVSGVVFPGTKVVIGEASMVVQSSYSYCRFEKIRGDVKSAPM